MTKVFFVDYDCSYDLWFKYVMSYSDTLCFYYHYVLDILVYISPLIEESLTETFPCTGGTVFLPFLFCFGSAHNIWKFLGQGSNLHHSIDPSCFSDNVGSVIHSTIRELLLLLLLIISSFVSPWTETVDCNIYTLWNFTDFFLFFFFVTWYMTTFCEWSFYLKKKLSFLFSGWKVMWSHCSALLYLYLFLLH